jgi:hypothetical protein
MAIYVFECVHVCGAGRVCGVGRSYGQKLARRELWTARTDEHKQKDTEREKHDKERKKTPSRLSRLVDLIFLHLPG